MLCSKKYKSSRFRIECFRKGIKIGLKSKKTNKKLSLSEKQLYCGKKNIRIKNLGNDYSCLKKGISLGKTRRKRKILKRRTSHRQTPKRRTKKQ